MNFPFEILISTLGELAPGVLRDNYPYSPKEEGPDRARVPGEVPDSLEGRARLLFEVVVLL